ncbi:MAG: hypothetical protein M0T71_02630, partial [Actinomycetota bacterium]|nr:hypothetical protein [Actinomycetota bacterium]
MARRIDIELTSSREDGTWTWRAAGAREPRGLVDAKLLSPTAHVGDVLRVEAELGLDGITVLSVLPAKERSSRGPTIEIEPRHGSGAGSVTSSLVERRQRRGDGERRGDGDRRGGGPGKDRGERGPRRADEPPGAARRPGGDGLSRFEYGYTVRSTAPDTRHWMTKLFSQAPPPPVSVSRVEENLGALRRQFITVPVASLAP